jgi:large subunit ribosomal protein L21
MYAVIKTGGKQYRVQAGDILIVEKLDGAPGDAVKFEEVLILGEGADVTVGAPLIDGASVSATLVETRKGEKIKVFKKIRRQGYRRTRGHRQPESVLRVTGISGKGVNETWDGEVDLTPLAVLNARARNLGRVMEAAQAASASTATVAKAPAKAKAAPAVKTSAAPAPEAVADEGPAAEAKKPAARRAAAPKAASAEAAPAKTAAPKKAAAKKPAAKAGDDA